MGKEDAPCDHVYDVVGSPVREQRQVCDRPDAAED